MPRFLRTHARDNVAIVVVPGGLATGTVLEAYGPMIDDVPMGHKMAVQAIPKGGPVVRYGEVIAYATEHIPSTAWVHLHNTRLPSLPNLKDLSFLARPDHGPRDAKEGFFQGYRNADGSVGTKNMLGITTSVQCVSGITRYVEERIRRELLPKYPHVDGVVALNHSYGCGVAIDVPVAEIPIRTIQNIARNPNFGDELLVIGLGCEKLLPERLLRAGDELAQDLLTIQDASLTGFSQMTATIMQMAERRLQKLNKRRREPCPISGLVVGLQCGGSDSFSGISGNPVAGYAADLIVQSGGTVIFSEVSEVRDAAHLLAARANDETVVSRLTEELAWYDDYLQHHGADRSANPTPGNRRGGLTNIVEKALGSIAKSGSTPIVDVVEPGDRVRKGGLNFLATPASDFICGTLQVAAGMNVHVFITGRGTPYGLPMVPVLKVSSNSTLGARWHDLIDLDAGPVVSGTHSVEELGKALYELILKTASGEYQVATDRLGLYNDLVLFNPGPIT